MPDHIRDKISDKLPDKVATKLPDKLTTSDHKAESSSPPDRTLSDPYPVPPLPRDHDNSLSTQQQPPPRHSEPLSDRQPNVDSSPRDTTSSPPPPPRHGLTSQQSNLLNDLSQRKYVLKTTAGPSYDPTTHYALPVNSPTALLIDSPHLTAKLKLRIRNFTGFPLSSPHHSPYFSLPEHAKDQYSVAFSFVPKHDISSANARWGNDFDHPVRDRLPPGVNTAFKIVKEFIDPGLAMDAYSDEPWLLGPATSCWFKLVVGERVIDSDAEAGRFPEPAEDEAMMEGGVGSGAEVRAELGMPDDSEKRRKWMLKAENRERFTFEKGRWYMADFFNPYLDFENFALKVPGCSINVVKYIDDKSHAMRYVFKDVETGTVYLCVVLTLLFGKKLEEELAGAKEGMERDGVDEESKEEDHEETGERGEEFEDAVESLDELEIKDEKT
ncbi:MAG: hypothetical protein Q9162_005613 [Coniocarpon cinnabarinum]